MSAARVCLAGPGRPPVRVAGSVLSLSDRRRRRRLQNELFESGGYRRRLN
jgi:hypothetical protein